MLNDRVNRMECSSYWPEDYFIQLAKPTSVTAPSKLALLRDGEWTVGGAEVRSAIGLPQLGDVLVDPHTLPEGDEVYLRSESLQWSANITVPVMYQLVGSLGTLGWQALTEDALKKPQDLEGPSISVLWAFITKLARYEIAIVETIEDYLYYHVLVADHVKYFDYVGPPVPPSLMAPALESPLRIPRILHALFSVGSAWKGPEGDTLYTSCPVFITVPNSWDLHKGDNDLPSSEEKLNWGGGKRVFW